MPSSPKIKKEDILQTALEIVTQDGYAALNIKAVAKKLGCSTAPISWQFGGMDGLRQELIPFAEKYVENTYYSFNENEFVAFEQRGKGTIDLALERPYLFRFLYMGERSQLLSNGFELQQDPSDGTDMYERIADILEITIEQAMDFAMTMMVYTQGMGTLIASGIVQDTKENMYCMLHNTGMTYLKGLGVGEDILQALSGGDESDADSSNG
jgi:AcrR family transcriptional regulator